MDGGGLHSDLSSSSGRSFEALPRLCVLRLLVVTVLWQHNTSLALGNALEIVGDHY